MIGLSVFELTQMLVTGRISSAELTEEYLEAIRKLDPDINAYITYDRDAVLREAKSIDERRARGELLGRLAGIPFAAKDNLCTEGIKTTCGSKMLDGFIPPYTATSVLRLQECGALLLGKTNMDEFGMGSATDTSYFGITKNPLDTARVAGGSSGGSAAAVVSHMAAFALGSDTGGSVRLPAAFCGCVGLKPTYGAISRYGLIAFASSLDTVGILSSNTSDCELIFSAVRGRDERDATSKETAVGAKPKKKKCMGICKDLLDMAESGTAAAVMRAAEVMSSAGIRIVSVELPDPDLCVAAYYVISSSEASSNLGRYDGIRYGYRNGAADSFDAFIRATRSEGFGDEVKRRIMIGSFCLHGNGRDHYYRAATAARNKITRQIKNVLCECDAVLLPTSRGVAYKFEDKKPTPLEVYRDDALCLYASLSGLPAITLPFGTDGGMPVGIQLMGDEFSEGELFSLGKLLEEAQK